MHRWQRLSTQLTQPICHLQTVILQQQREAEKRPRSSDEFSKPKKIARQQKNEQKN